MFEMIPGYMCVACLFLLFLDGKRELPQSVILAVLWPITLVILGYKELVKLIKE